MGTTADKLTYLNGTKQAIKDSLNLGGANISTEPFRAYSSKLKGIYKDFLANGTDTLWNNWEKVSGSGETLSLTPTIKGKMKIELKGNTYQYSTTGKNKLSPIANASASDNGITLTNNNGVYKLSGSTPSSSDSNITRSLNYNYTIQNGDYLHIGNSVANGSVSIGLLNNGTQVSAPNFSEVNRIVNLSDKAGQTINQLRIYTTSSQSVNMELKPMICNSSSTTEFEYYTGGIPSPNPDYPQDIQVVSGDNEIKVEGKNLFTVTDKAQTTDSRGITYKVENNVITLTGTSTSTAAYSLISWVSGSVQTHLNTLFEKGKTFTLKANNSVGLSGIYFQINYFKEGATGQSQLINLGGLANKITFTIPQDFDRTGNVFIGVYNSQPTLNGSFSFQLEEGSTATDFVPYQSQTYPISLGNIELCKIGDYQDYIYKDSGKWYLNKQIGKVVLDGSENWDYYSVSQGSLFRYTDINDNIHDNSYSIYCNYYKGIPASLLSNRQNNNIYLNWAYGNTMFLDIIDNRYSNTTNFKTWLSTHNTTVYYVLETPTYTEITDTTLLSQLNALEGARSYDNQTNVSQANNDLAFVLDITALKEMS